MPVAAVLDLWYGSSLFRRPELELTSLTVFAIEDLGAAGVLSGVAVRARRRTLCRAAMVRGEITRKVLYRKATTGDLRVRKQRRERMQWFV